MKAIILAAGRGSRMEEGTADKPKCMMELCGKSLLDFCTEGLVGAGFSLDDIGIITGYKSEMLHKKQIHYFHNEEWAQTNMFVSLTKARKWLIKEPCIVSYSDIVFHPNAIKKLMVSNADLAITYYTNFWELWSKRFDDPLQDLETFRVENCRLIEIGKHPTSREQIEGQYMGLLRFTPASWAKVEQVVSLPMAKPVEKLDMTTLLQHLIDSDYLIEAIPTSELWLECDNMRDVCVYEKEYINYLCSKVDRMSDEFR